MRNLHIKSTIKKNKALIITITILLSVSILICLITLSVNTSSLNSGITIVIDAGHGGRDGGSVGSNGSIEKELNLKYAKALKTKLVKAGYNVVMTRESDAGLYNPSAENKKISDMDKRMRIIKNANPNLVISIHMNSFTDESVGGYQVFYKIDDEASENIARLVSSSIATECNTKDKEIKEGDYYILNCSYYTSILIECGYLSNIHDEEQLNSKEYLDKFTTGILDAIEIYFGKIKNL